MTSERSSDLWSSEEAGPAAMRAHISAAAAHLPELEACRAEVRRLFLLFYTVTDDLCAHRGPSGVVVDLTLVDVVRRHMAEALSTGACPGATTTPAELFNRFWRALTDLTGPTERDRLAEALRGLADAMKVKYRCIASSQRLGLDKFVAVRRQVPGMSFLELERVLQVIPPPSTAFATVTENVADYLSLTNDLHSITKERDEGFNLVLVLRSVLRITEAEAVVEAERRLHASHAQYSRAKESFVRASGSASTRLLAVYDDVMAAVAPLHLQASRYRQTHCI